MYKRQYKTSVYHPNSNLVERVLREVGRILRTYCFDKHQKWNDNITQTESFITLAYHEAIQDTPYTIMHERLPPREISEIIKFPNNPAYQFDNVRFHSKLNEQVEKRRKKYKIVQQKIIQYKIGDKVLLKNLSLIHI